MPAPLALLSTVSAPDDLLLDLLAVSLTGVILYHPLYDATGALTDFTFLYLNPAAQQLTGLPERPTVTHQQHWPPRQGNGTFASLVEAFESGLPRHFHVTYPADNSDTYFEVAARRSGTGLLVSFTATAAPPRLPVEQALRESQAREQAAHAEVEAQRQRFYEVLLQLPASVAINRGLEHVYDVVNPRYQQLFQRRQLLGLPIRAALPELRGQGVIEKLNHVYQTGEPHNEHEQETWVDVTDTGRPARRYYNVLFFPLRDAGGRVDGLLNFAYDVTEHVETRQQLQLLNQELAISNEELRATNEEYQATNLALSEAQQQLQQLNQALEKRVQESTRQALDAQAATLAAAQRELRQREVFHQVFEQTPALIALLRQPSHRIEYVNPAYQQVFAGRQLVGLDLGEALPELQAPGYLARIDHVYQSGETYCSTEQPLVVPQPADQPPRRAYFNFTYQAYREQGEIAGISVFAYEVTNQVRARQHLEQREASFRTMADAAPAMLWVTDPAGQCTYLNAQWYQYTGQTETEALGLGWTKAVHPDDAEMAGRAFLEANARRVPFHLRYRLRRYDGEYRWAIDTGLPRFTEAGEYAGIVGTVIDVHEQQLAEDELQATNQRLTRTNADLDNFIYTASHDLKAPISNIEGLLYLLREELPPEVAQGEYVGPTLTRMLEAVERFKRTIDHLTDVSKLQKEHAQANTAVDVAAVVKDVREDLQPLLAQTGARLLVDVADVPPVQFSTKNLRSVVYNLLSNALKYRHPDRTLHVDVRAHVRTGYTVLEVHDNGLGMEAYHLPKLFTMFQRFHPHVEGSGIGLYMVKRMVDNAGGRIEVHSQPGAGTTFLVYLPHATSTPA